MRTTLSLSVGAMALFVLTAITLLSADRWQAAALGHAANGHTAVAEAAAADAKNKYGLSMLEALCGGVLTGLAFHRAFAPRIPAEPVVIRCWLAQQIARAEQQQELQSQGDSHARSES